MLRGIRKFKGDAGEVFLPAKSVQQKIDFSTESNEMEKKNTTKKQLKLET